MDQVQEIREKVDLISFISEYLPLKKAGRNFKTNCPFHNENTPSLVISPERQIWHCFGCGKGGDVYTFLMEYENMEFSESLRVLAKRTGITLKESAYRQNQYSEKEKIFSINNLALKYYHYLLTEHKIGIQALSYLKDKRKITNSSINTFELGFSPNTNSSLSEFLIKKKGFTNKDLVIAGIAIEKGGQIFDFFKGRIMFPLFDHRGNVTGFSGRSLNDLEMPKYINTKETSVYHKGNMFFGLNVTKDDIKLKQDAIIVEGEFDAISLFEENVKNVIAIKGTALTEGQVNLLSRFTPKVTLCLDQDSAGFEATKRSLEVLEKKGLVTDTLVLKDAKDPDEAIKKDLITFKKQLKNKIGIYDFIINKYVEENDVESATGKREITDNVLPILSNISNEIIKEHYLKKISKILDVSYESIFKETDKHRIKKTEEKIIIPRKNQRSEREIIEEYVVSLVIQSKNPKDLLDENKKFFIDFKFESLALGKLMIELYDYLDKNIRLDSLEFSKKLPTELITVYNICSLYPLSKFGLDDGDEEKYERELNKKIERLKEFYSKDKFKKIS